MNCLAISMYHRLDRLELEYQAMTHALRRTEDCPLMAYCDSVKPKGDATPFLVANVGRLMNKRHPISRKKIDFPPAHQHGRILRGVNSAPIIPRRKRKKALEKNVLIAQFNGASDGPPPWPTTLMVLLLDRMIDQAPVRCTVMSALPSPS